MHEDQAVCDVASSQSHIDVGSLTFIIYVLFTIFRGQSCVKFHLEKFTTAKYFSWKQLNVLSIIYTFMN